MERKIFAIVYEGERRPKLPKGSEIISSFLGDDLYELLAGTVVRSIIFEEGFCFTGFVIDKFIHSLADYFQHDLLNYFSTYGSKEEAVELLNSYFDTDCTYLRVIEKLTQRETKEGE